MPEEEKQISVSKTIQQWTFNKGWIMSHPETMCIDNVEYVRKDVVSLVAEKVDGLEYCIVRTYSAGVFAGFVKEKNGQNGVVLNARRLWYWDGAASLSQLSVDGVSKPGNCKFPCEVAEVRLTQIVEVLPCTQKAIDSIKAVSVWQK